MWLFDQRDIVQPFFPICSCYWKSDKNSSLQERTSICLNFAIDAIPREFVYCYPQLCQVLSINIENWDNNKSSGFFTSHVRLTFLCLSVLFTYISSYLSIYLIYLSILSILSILFIYLSIYLSIYIYIYLYLILYIVVEAYHVGNEGIYEHESVQKTIGKKKKMDWRKNGCQNNWP